MEFDDPPDIGSILKLPRRHEAAPRFDGQPSSLVRYLDEICFLGKASNYSDREIIEAAIFYTPDDDYELWNQIEEASGNDWEAFRTAIIDLYPGADGERKYSFRDLEDLVEDNSKKPIIDVNQFGTFYRNFIRVSSFLKSKSRLTSCEEARMFLLGLHIDLRKAVRARLRLKNPDHHPDDPWTFKEVLHAAIFVISPSAVGNDTTVGSIPESSLRCSINTQNKHAELLDTHQKVNIDPVTSERAKEVQPPHAKADAIIDRTADAASVQPLNIPEAERTDIAQSLPCEAAPPFMSATFASSNTNDTHQVNSPDTALCRDQLEELEISDPPPPYREESRSPYSPAVQVPSITMTSSLNLKATHQAMKVDPNTAVWDTFQLSSTSTAACCVGNRLTFALPGDAIDVQSIQKKQVEVDVKDHVQEKFALASRSHKRHDLKIDLYFGFAQSRSDLNFLWQLVPIGYPAKHSDKEHSRLCLNKHGTLSCQENLNLIVIYLQFIKISNLSSASENARPNATSVFNDRINISSSSFRIDHNLQDPSYLPSCHEVQQLSKFPEVFLTLIRYMHYFLSDAIQVVLSACVLHSDMSSALATHCRRHQCHAQGICPRFSLYQSHRHFSPANGEVKIYPGIRSWLSSTRLSFGFDKDNPHIRSEDFPTSPSSKVPGKSGSLAPSYIQDSSKFQVIEDVLQAIRRCKHNSVFSLINSPAPSQKISAILGFTLPA